MMVTIEHEKVQRSLCCLAYAPFMPFIGENIVRLEECHSLCLGFRYFSWFRHVRMSTLLRGCACWLDRCLCEWRHRYSFFVANAATFFPGICKICETFDSCLNAAGNLHWLS
jgi:hypothetical protein